MQEPRDALTGAAHAPALRRLVAAAYRADTRLDEIVNQCAARAACSPGYGPADPMHSNLTQTHTRHHCAG